MKAPCKCFLVKEFIKYDVEKLIFNFFKTSQRRYLGNIDFSIPKSEKCNEIIKFGRGYYSSVLEGHALRSYFFGLIFAELLELKIDKEVFFAGSYLHDIGLAQPNKEKTFEVVGADMAVKFCEEYFDRNNLGVIHNMVELHDAIGVASKKQNETKLLHMGAGVDIAGLWSYRIHPKNRDEVYNLYPSQGHNIEIINLLKLRLEQNPNMFLSSLINMGFFNKMKKYQKSLEIYTS